MKTLILMVALSLDGHSYIYVPAVAVDENSCLMLAEQINSYSHIYQHAYCTAYTPAPFITPRPKARP